MSRSSWPFSNNSDNAARVRTVVMPSTDLTLAKLTGDPTCTWRVENQLIAESEATFGAVRMHTKTIACMVKFSVEFAQNSSNVEEILSSSITSAMARAIDAAGLVGVTGAGAGSAPMQGAGVTNLTGRNSVTSTGAPTSWDLVLDGAYERMLDNVPTDGGAFVGHPALWRKMAKLKTGITDDATPLPVDVARIPKLWTTAAPFTGGNACNGIVANWADMLTRCPLLLAKYLSISAFFGLWRYVVGCFLSS